MDLRDRFVFLLMLLKQQPVKPMQIVNSNNLRQRTRARTTTRDKMTATTTATTASMAQGLTTTSMESIRNGRTNNQQTSATRLFSTAVGGIDSMMDDGDSVNNNSDVQGEFISSNVPEIHPEQPFLHKIPSGVFPTYRPLPLLAQFLVLILSMWVSAVTTWKRLSWLQPLAILQGWRQPPAVKDLVLFATKVLKHLPPYKAGRRADGVFCSHILPFLIPLLLLSSFFFCIGLASDALY